MPRNREGIVEVGHQRAFRTDHAAQKIGLRFGLDVADCQRAHRKQSALADGAAEAEKVDAFDPCRWYRVDVGDDDGPPGGLQM